MSFVGHLEELRKTVLRIMLILLVSFAVSYGFGRDISEFLLAPLRESLQGGVDLKGGQIVYLSILDKVISQLQVAFWSSVILSSPLWFREIWLFIRPGLHSHEVKAVRPFIWVGFFLFALGVAFGYYVLFPFAFETLLDFGVEQATATLALKEHLILTCKVLVFLGLVFQLPNALLILGFMGLVTKQSLRSMRRYVYVGLAAMAAMMTPPDIFTMLGLWTPLALLFEVGVGAVAWIVHPYLARQQTREQKREEESSS